ncbi:arylamine N-acetyltransferase family protein [Curtobacterium sp. S6]|uniref:arylamine N-acetyltransferase family protein n=1 Tax=Curtobacterium sp. S6 TaxID=1479623 RepID=UPI00068B7971|nr:arylamine N-acetyltransferase [Curtobacterium sp. S6]
MDTADRSSWGVGAYDVAAYLSAVGLPAEFGEAAPDLETLKALHTAHVRSLPFSNVQVLLGDHPGVTPEVVFAQLVERRRGGYCFEHAQLFAGILERLGLSVTRHLGRVGGPENTRTHLTVRVSLAGRDYLCDPGFGFSLCEPMPWEDGAEHVENDRVLSLARTGQGASTAWEFRRDGEVQHVIDELPVVPADVSAGHAVTSMTTLGPFTRHLMVMRHTDNGHVTVTEAGRTVRERGQETRQERLSPAEVVAAVEDAGVRIDCRERERLIAVVETMQTELPDD